MTTSIPGEWTDEEVQQIEYCLLTELESHTGFATFVEDEGWIFRSVERRHGSKSLVDVKLSRISDDKRLNFEFEADDRNVEWGHSSGLTDQVFWLTIILMEYVGIFGIEELDNDFTVKLIPRRSVYEFKPPWYVEPVVDPNVSYTYRSPFHKSTRAESGNPRFADELEVISLIRETLQQLDGLNVRSLGHQVWMLMIGFGGVTLRPSSVGPNKGEIREESDFHLHISTIWQVLENDRVIINNDAEGLYDDDGRPTVESLAILDSTIGHDRTVENVSVADNGSIDINLTGNVSIRISRSSDSGEEWRLWATNRGNHHFVIEIAEVGQREGLLTMSGDLLD
jgi:hypothetical protein